MAKYIFIAGGVMSGIGKGITTASIGRILKGKGFKVQAMKIDPYINVDAGTMNPIEHGEVFVTEDGDECDQDVGNYERFLGENLGKDNYMTTGRIYRTVIEKERNLEYGGKCVQVVPHIPEEVMRRIKKIERKTKTDFILIEIGGTVGEYENLIFLETARILKLQKPKDIVFILVSYLPIPEKIGEMKTKPTQHAVRSLNSAGIQPDIIIARSAVPLDHLRKKKISIFCNVSDKDVISAPDIKSIYEVPINFEKEGLGNRILKKFGMKVRKTELGKWKKIVSASKNPSKKLKIGIIGKYFKTGKFTLLDSYISIIEALKHASYSLKTESEIIWLDAEDYEDKKSKRIRDIGRFDGIIVPGGFGSRGVEGKINTIEFCRKNKIPFFGLCLGMQLLTIEFLRNVCGLKGATSAEFDKNSKYKVIDVMPDQKEKIKKKTYGGTMRLGKYPCVLKPGTISRIAYGSDLVSERHRHRYELNNDFRKILEKHGLVMAGVNPEKNLAEIVEMRKISGGHPFFIGVQFHPEFKSKFLEPHPLFREFIKAALKKKFS